MAHPTSALPAPTAPPRSGQPWTDAEYEQILSAAREGVDDIEEIARRIGRSPQPTLVKARRLLPVAERSAPVDRVLPLIREHLSDPGYDWRQVTLEEPPPRPIITPPARTGLPGLADPDLLQVGYAVGLAAAVLEREVVERVGDELSRRHQLGPLAAFRANRLLERPGGELTVGEARVDADEWVERVFGRRAAIIGWDYFPDPQEYSHW